MKIGYIVDSSCGLTEKEAHKRGWGYLPLLFTINDHEYEDGKNLDAKAFYGKINSETSSRTSATPPGITHQIFEKASKEFDQVVVYALSTKLSSQVNNLKIIAKEYGNIHVINSYGVGYAIVRDIEDVEKQTDVIKTVRDLNALSLKQFGIAIPKDLKSLVKGGRISPAIAKMANLLRIIPIIKFEKGSLDKYGKGRVFEKTVGKIAKSLKHKHPKAEFLIYHGQYDGIDITINNIKLELGEKTEVKYFPPVIASHTGPEVMAIMVRSK